ncbi:hypothetical protein BMR02_07295 [Methylococcaceae bacterium HT1]|nr:hypothetical protein BMR02_07295 [Methylococcaceae bacterium HT1]
MFSEGVTPLYSKEIVIFFLKNESNLTAKQKTIKEELSMAKLNLKSIRAMQIREAFKQVYVAESTEQFEGLLNNWYYWATHSQLKFPNY